MQQFESGPRWFDAQSLVFTDRIDRTYDAYRYTRSFQSDAKRLAFLLSVSLPKALARTDGLVDGEPAKFVANRLAMRR